MLISLTYLFKVLCGLLLAAMLVLNLSAAQAENQIALAGSVPTQADSILNNSDLSADSLNLAKSLGISPQLDQLTTLKRTAGSDSNELISLKIDLLESVLTASYETRSVVNKIDKELAQSGEVNTYINEQRDRALRMNTYVNFISGGITRMVTGGLTLGSVNHIAPDTLTAIEGVIQTSLASWGVWQLRGEKRLERSGKENMLAPIFDPSARNSINYPPSVWSFLNSSPSGTNTQPSRRELLLDHWYKHGLYLMKNKRKNSDVDRVQKVSGSNQISFRLTSDILQDRMTMLTDLRATVEQMDDNLLEILQVIRKK